jgi:sugar phosphate isomerase/epimerase
MLTALVKSFESPCVRQSLDTGHAYINFVQGAPPPDYYIKTAGDLLGHIHLQDTDGYSDRHWTIGEGKIDWAEIFASVRALSHTPRLILELRDYDDIPRAMAWFAERGLGR